MDHESLAVAAAKYPESGAFDVFSPSAAAAAAVSAPYLLFPPFASVASCAEQQQPQSCASTSTAPAVATPLRVTPHARTAPHGVQRAPAPAHAAAAKVCSQLNSENTTYSTVLYCTVIGSTVLNACTANQLCLCSCRSN